MVHFEKEASVSSQSHRVIGELFVSEKKGASGICVGRCSVPGCETRSCIDIFWA
jgi:hypothetical protein